MQGSHITRNILFLTLFSFVVPFLVILFLNWKVFKTAKILQRNVVTTAQVRTPGRSESHLQEMSRRMREHKAAVDVSIIISVFLLCFFPGWIIGLCRQFANSINVPAEAILSTTCVFFVSSLCNPIIYSIRKKDFRTGVKKLLRRNGIFSSSNDISVAVRAKSFFSRTTTEEPFTRRQNQNGDICSNTLRATVHIPCLSPLPEISE